MARTARHWMGGGLLGIALLAASAAAQAQDAATATLDAAALFQRRCSVCHGELGNGQSRATRSLATAPRDFTSEESRTRLTRQYMIAVVRDGRPSSPMVGRRNILTQDEIEAIVDFIRTAFMVPEPGTSRAEGHALYRKSCANCHGVRGRGVMTGGGAVRASLRSSGLPVREAVRRVLEQDQHPGGAQLRLTNDQAAAVAEYVSTAFIEKMADAAAPLAAGYAH